MENIPTWKWKGSNKFNGAFHRLRVPKIEGSIWYTMAINWHPHWNKVVWSPNKIPPKATKRSCFKGPKEDLNKCRASFPLLTTDHLHFHRLLEKYLEIEPKDLRCQDVRFLLRSWEALQLCNQRLPVVLRRWISFASALGSWCQHHCSQLPMSGSRKSPWWPEWSRQLQEKLLNLRGNPVSASLYQAPILRNMQVANEPRPLAFAIVL